MKKFIIQHSREGKTIIMEVEVEMITATEDPSVMWLPEGEYKARVMEPKSLYDRDKDGFLTPPVWHSHAFYWTSAQAWAHAERQIREGFERDLRKYGIAYTEQQIQEKLAQIQEITLP